MPKYKKVTAVIPKVLHSGDCSSITNSYSRKSPQTHSPFWSRVDERIIFHFSFSHVTQERAAQYDYFPQFKEVGQATSIQRTFISYSFIMCLLESQNKRFLW